MSVALSYVLLPALVVLSSLGLLLASLFRPAQRRRLLRWAWICLLGGLGLLALIDWIWRLFLPPNLPV